SINLLQSTSTIGLGANASLNTALSISADSPRPAGVSNTFLYAGFPGDKLQLMGDLTFSTAVGAFSDNPGLPSTASFDASGPGNGARFMFQPIGPLANVTSAGGADYGP